MAKYRKKPVVVDGRHLTGSELVTTAHGRVRAEAGDWVLTDLTSGDTWPIKPDIFEATYELVAGPSVETSDQDPGKIGEPTP